MTESLKSPSFDGLKYAAPNMAAILNQVVVGRTISEESKGVLKSFSVRLDVFLNTNAFHAITDVREMDHLPTLEEMEEYRAIKDFLQEEYGISTASERRDKLSLVRRIIGLVISGEVEKRNVEEAREVRDFFSTLGTYSLSRVSYG